MARRPQWEKGFDEGSLAVIVALLRLEGWRVQVTARDLLRDFQPNLKTASEDDRATLREFKLIN